MTIHFLYKTTCVITNKFYYGMHSTNNFNDGYLGSGKLLIRSLKKYGKDNHIIEVIRFCETREQLKIEERELINETVINNPLCMNLKVGGEGGGVKGIVRSEETKKKISEGNKGKSKSIESILKRREKMRNYTHSKETKDKMSKTRTGKKMPPFSEDHKKRLSEARKQRVITDKTRRKISESISKRLNDPEYKRKLSEKMLGNKNATKNKYNKTNIINEGEFDGNNCLLYNIEKREEIY